MTNIEKIYEIVVQSSDNKKDIKEMGLTTQDASRC